MIETLKRTPLFEEHKALAGRIVPFAGWEMPVQYAGLLKEHQAVRTAAGLFDVSHMGEMILEGPNAEEVIDGLVTADLTKLPDGKAVYNVACNERGTILDDLIVYRRARDRFLIVMNASNRDKIAAHFRKHCEGKLSFEDASDRFSLIAIQGPKAVDIVRAAGASDAIPALASFSLTDGEVAGVAVIAARTGYTAEDGFELFCANGDAPTLWRALVSAGKPLGLEPCGLGARDTLRLEGRLSLYGNEIDETTNPLEAGLGWVVKLDKPRDFVGKEALRRSKRRGSHARWSASRSSAAAPVVTAIRSSSGTAARRAARRSASSRADRSRRVSTRTSASATCRPRSRRSDRRSVSRFAARRSKRSS